MIEPDIKITEPVNVLRSFRKYSDNAGETLMNMIMKFYRNNGAITKCEELS